MYQTLVHNIKHACPDIDLAMQVRLGMCLHLSDIIDKRISRRNTDNNNNNHNNSNATHNVVLLIITIILYHVSAAGYEPLFRSGSGLLHRAMPSRA